MSDLIDREQAKDAIDKYLVGRNLVTDGTMMARLINMSVIERLPSAQPEIKQQAINSSDCIDRQAALDALRKMQTYKLFSGDDMLLIDQAGAQTELMLLPPIQPKRGRWERGFDGNHAVCSNCKAWWIPFGEGYKTDYHFCPNCGADMREVAK